MEEKYEQKDAWTKSRLKTDVKIAYPSEYVIRILKGNYPNLKLDKNVFQGKKFCDIGCGDGRNIALAKECGFNVYGIELSEPIVERIKSNLTTLGVAYEEIKAGSNNNIPFDNEFFDYVLSWNSVYYMGDETDFNNYVKEIARVINKDGYLILSIPKKTAFIFKDSVPHKQGYRIIKDDYFNVRNGEVFRVFDDEKEIEESFSEYFKNFTFGSIHDDCFGLAYHWHLVVCQKK